MLFGMADMCQAPGEPSETPLEPQEAHVEMVCLPFNELARKRVGETAPAIPNSMCHNTSDLQKHFCDYLLNRGH